MMEYISLAANIIGILAGILAAVSWVKSKKHSTDAQRALVVVKNYKYIEAYTEINKQLETIKSNIRDYGMPGAKKIPAKYMEIEKNLEKVIAHVPLKHNELIDEIRSVEKAIRKSADANAPLIGADQYKVLSSIDTVRMGIKGIMEKMEQELTEKL